jgi:hypothetical protein
MSELNPDSLNNPLGEFARIIWDNSDKKMDNSRPKNDID